MGNHYPISLNLSGKKVTIIGGGKIAERKIKGLLETGAKLEVVSPELTPELGKLVKARKVTWHEKYFSQKDIEDSFLVIAATNDKEMNQLVKKATGTHQLVCLVDDPGQSDFLLSSVLRRGKLIISISTSGASPILAKKIRKQLETEFDERYEDYLDFLAEARKFILDTVKDEGKKRRLLTAIVDPSYLESNNREEEFQKLVNTVLFEL